MISPDGVMATGVVETEPGGSKLAYILLKVRRKPYEVYKGVITFGRKNGLKPPLFWAKYPPSEEVT
jgi:hypothetical protein